MAMMAAIILMALSLGSLAGAIWLRSFMLGVMGVIGIFVAAYLPEWFS